MGGTFAPWNFRSMELSSPGTFAPESENNVELSLPEWKMAYNFHGSLVQKLLLPLTALNSLSFFNSCFNDFVAKSVCSVSYTHLPSPRD